MIVMQDVLRVGADTLELAGIEEYQLDAWYLLSYCMNITRSEYYMRMKEEISIYDYERYRELIDRRASHVPLQYITGTQEFMGLEFMVNEFVLIPRQDTELLAELALKYSEGKRVLDMCTGSGCIAVSISKLGSPVHVTGIDISPDALEVARHNAIINDASVEYIESNLWNNVEGVFDIVVSNPPYITDDEMQSLMPEVREHEPELALEGGYDGLDYYRRIIGRVNEHLISGGLIMFEIGCSQAAAVSELLEKQGFTDIKVEQDLAGLDRVVWALRQ